MGVDHGETGDKSPPPNLERGDCPPRFCHVAKFYAPDYLHYNVVRCVFCLYSRTFIVSPAIIPVRSYAYAGWDNSNLSDDRIKFVMGCSH